MKAIRCGRGLGDSIYLESVCRHLIEKNGEPLRVYSDWPDVFRPLGDKAKVVPFGRTGIDILAHYATRKSAKGTTQFQDCCINAGIREPVELRLDWVANQSATVDRLLSFGKPILCIGLPRSPMGRTDGFGKELLPRGEVTQKIIDRIHDRFTTVQVGAGTPLFKYRGIDVDLANRTTVAEMLDVCHAAAGFIGYVSFVLPVAESMRKPALMVWSRAGLNDRQEYVRQITPEKVIEHKQDTMVVMDDAQDFEIEGKANAFLR